MNKIIDPSAPSPVGIHMDQNYKAKWVAALRSGQFVQGKSVLHNLDNNTHCCLGVLCHILKDEGIIKSDEVQENIRSHSLPPGQTIINVERFGAIQGFDWDRETGLLPASAAMAVGLVEADEYSEEYLKIEDPALAVDLGRGPEVLVMSVLNDLHGLSFTALADLIEAQL